MLKERDQCCHKGNSELEQIYHFFLETCKDPYLRLNLENIIKVCSHLALGSSTTKWVSGYLTDASGDGGVVINVRLNYGLR